MTVAMNVLGEENLKMFEGNLKWKMKSEIEQKDSSHFRLSGKKNKSELWMRNIVNFNEDKNASK